MRGDAPLRQVALEDRYAVDPGRALMNGAQALVRALLLQHGLDRTAGLRTAGFVSGYRGSPLGGLDGELWSAGGRLAAADVLFRPGVNEDLAATAVWGTQQAPLLPEPKYDGVYALWYGKGPGVDRSGDAFKHGNRQGASRHGGVLVCFGDDHPGKSSTVAHQSEQALAASQIPVLYPASVQEIVDYALLGWAMSRFSGCWVGLKLINETAEGTATVDVDSARHRYVSPAVDAPATGLNANPRPMIHRDADERLVTRHRLPAVQAFARANGVDRVVLDAPRRTLGLVASGKGYATARLALAALGIDAARAAALGLRLYKPGLIWPLEPAGLREFALDHAELLFVEEKAAFVEDQAARILYDLPGDRRPRIVGKRDDAGAALLPADDLLGPHEVAFAIARRLEALGLVDDALRGRVATLQARTTRLATRTPASAARTPYFCSGCPHNTSTRVPDGSFALAGIGCHVIAGFMDRRTLLPTQMGGEGLNWTGIAPFTRMPHVFQNLGDGTYFHSGLLAIRAAVAADVNVTYKILYNDAVAMTGGQPVEGQLSPVEIAAQLLAERVRRVAIVSDAPSRYRDALRPPRGVTVHGREELDALQQEFRALPGVTAIVYEQTCAAEKRRRRKRGAYPDPPRRLHVNAEVCEGCGDCSVQSNCVSILPRETPLGRKRRIDQASCNKDYSCAEGFCPSFVSIHGGRPRRATRREFTRPAVPPPAVAAPQAACNVLVAGIGGTGVITIGAVLAMAAHLDGRHAATADMTGLAQKNGAVWSHVRIGAGDEPAPNLPIGPAEADVLLACDLLAATERQALASLAESGTVVANTWLQPTGRFQTDPEERLERESLLATLGAVVGPQRLHAPEASSLAQALLGDALGANFLLVGAALQAGVLPLSVAAVERAIELNGQAVAMNLAALSLGRLAIHDPGALARLDRPAPEAEPPAPETLEEIVAHRRALLADYQDEAYAQRYARLVERVARLERERTGGSALALAVARNYYRLLAYKDEYEVARLHASPAFRRELEREFEGPFELRFHLAPPLLSRRDSRTGRIRKREFGPWILPAFRLLARLRHLRGTPFDPFGWQAERRTERRLIGEYETQVEEILGRLSAETLAAALELASWPETVRGYGHVKAVQLAAARRRTAKALDTLRKAGADASG